MQELEIVREKLQSKYRVVKTDEDLEWNRAIDLCTNIINAHIKHMADDWIPVEERLPGIGRKVLVSFRYTGWQPVIAFLSEEHRWLMLQGMKGYNDVTHDVSAWMPLPKPYHPKSEGWKENLLKKFDKRT